MSRTVLATFLVLLAAPLVAADFPTPTEGDYVMGEFQFTTGEGMSHLNLHYTTIGTPVKNAAGVVTKAVLIMHGTGGSGRGFLSANFGGELFGPGQPLDATKYYIILPDDIGHGKSRKPSDGMHAQFPHYATRHGKADYLIGDPDSSA